MKVEELVYGLALGPLAVIAVYVIGAVVYENVKDIVVNVRNFSRGEK